MSAADSIPGQTTVDQQIGKVAQNASLDVVPESEKTPANGPVKASGVGAVSALRPAVGCPICHTAHEAFVVGSARIIPCPAMRKDAVMVSPGFAVELRKAEGNIAHARPEKPAPDQPARPLTVEELTLRKLGRS